MSDNIPRLSGEYNRGFTAGLEKAREVFSYVHHDFASRHKRMTHRQIMELLAVMIDNRAVLREDLEGFVRWNVKTEKFEWYDGGRGNDI